MHSAAGPLSVSALLQLCPDDKQPDGDGGFFSLRFGAEHGVVPMAEELQGAMVRKGSEYEIAAYYAPLSAEAEIKAKDVDGETARRLIQRERRKRWKKRDRGS